MDIKARKKALEQRKASLAKAYADLAKAQKRELVMLLEKHGLDTVDMNVLDKEFKALADRLKIEDKKS